MTFGSEGLEITLVIGTAFGERCDMIDLVASVQWEPAAGAPPPPRRSYDFLEIWSDVPFHALNATSSTYCGSSGVGCQTKCAIERTQSGGAHLVLPPAKEQDRYTNCYNDQDNQHSAFVCQQYFASFKERCPHGPSTSARSLRIRKSRHTNTSPNGANGLRFELVSTKGA